MSIGEGSVFNYCRRVIRALRQLGTHAVAWPDQDRKEEIKAAAFEKSGLLTGCIGAIDGTLIYMERKPKVQGDSYVSGRVKRTCVSIRIKLNKALGLTN